jgi:hypothetical protein
MLGLGIMLDTPWRAFGGAVAAGGAALLLWGARAMGASGTRTEASAPGREGEAPALRPGDQGSGGSGMSDGPKD